MSKSKKKFPGGTCCCCKSQKRGKTVASKRFRRRSRMLIQQERYEHLPIMQTDIMLHFKNGKTLIIDAKYYGQTMQYHFNKATIHSHNLYQIHTYVINQDKNHEGNVDGMLLYAKTEEEITPNGQIHLNDGNVISFKTLDLNQDFHQIKKRLNSFISNYMVR